ncbi:hypothetical protein BLS_004159 [Venturia inaequalis]|uniref:Translin n=1 Tax=Venturia inaequalis TaxID=5025 RepID=A0A8H3VUQ6_VENIN|nr:hypothetical protein BLS_004159 [Venturia inaequalis]KAE9980872.1 hypothetical protein EG328_012008 [Venturia inaequalis]KAE9993243.1 hypothetical protein EG327_005850 [Venturia inaequalis]RDI88014.1 hypothetical protein Vi05172_g2060 [Venturia inaequalis]
MAHGMVDPAIFEGLQSKIDDDKVFRDSIRDLVQELEKQARTTQSILSRVHSTPSAKTASVVKAAEAELQGQFKTIRTLAEKASTQPYYKWNSMWTRQIQDVIFSVLFTGWLGGLHEGGETGQLFTIEQVGAAMQIPTNLKDRDAFHITIEEYLLALVSLTDELGRLARNSVTLQDFRRPLQIAQFIKDVFSGFQILNLKNDILRKRVDALKYRVKEVEDVVYDLSLRGLVPKEEESAA